MTKHKDYYNTDNKIMVVLVYIFMLGTSDFPQVFHLPSMIRKTDRQTDPTSRRMINPACKSVLGILDTTCCPSQNFQFPPAKNIKRTGI